MAKGIKLRLLDGVIPLSNLSNLICLWWDQTDVYEFYNPIGRTNVATTDANGDLILDLTEVSGVPSGQQGFLVVYKEDAIEKNSLVFANRVVVGDYSNGTKLYVEAPIENTWKRNPDWQTYTEPSTEKFVGLHAVFESGSNFLALSAEGNYTVDWGDGGSTENFNSGVVAYHIYDYTAFDSGKATQGAVTFTDSTNTVNKNSHGRLDGETVSFASITTTTGITVGQVYYVINATENTYQLSETLNGSVINLTNDGSGYTLKYKTVVVQVYPQNGQNLTKLDLNQKHNQSLLNFYSSGWLDVSLYAPNCTDLRVGVQNPDTGSSNISIGYLEQINIISSDLRQCRNLLAYCYSLQSIKNLVTSSAPATSMSCTFTDSGDLVTASNHGFRNGDSVIFTAINSTTGITVNSQYYVINKDTNTFQISTTYGGTAEILTTDGTGIALRGTDCGNMFDSCNSLKSVSLFDTSSVIDFYCMFLYCNALKSVPLFDTVSGINFGSMFESCVSLKLIPLFNTSASIFFGGMFRYCSALKSVPLFDTSSGTSFSSMFQYCNSLESVPLLDTSSGINFSYMFQNCTSLKSVPLFDTSSGINFSSMFYNCNILKSVPLFNTSSGTSFSSMFRSCYSLKSVPLFNTSSGTDFTYMFYGNSLKSVPLFDTSSGTDFSYMFYGDFLESVPLFDTSSGTSFSSMFYYCKSLKSVPLFDTSLGTDFTYMFYYCDSLKSVPLLNTSSGTSFSNMFYLCPSLSKGALSGTKESISYASCQLSSTALNEIFSYLASNVSSKTITVTNNWGTTKVATGGATTTSGSTTVTMANTTGLSANMWVTGTNISSSRSVTFQDTGDTVTLNNHGIPNSTRVSFTAITSGIGLTLKTIYYVVNTQTNTFQVSDTVGGAAKTLTNNASGTLIYENYIISVVPNTSITISIPASGSSTTTLTSTTMNPYLATLKGWTVTN
jgi:hypothetical protein